MINLILFLNMIMVDIKGEILNPGVYEIESGTISDIINLAGGITANGDTTYINLSRGLTDEMVIYIPNRRERNILDPVCNCPPLEIIYTCPPKIEATRPITTTLITTTRRETTTTIPTTRPIGKININTAALEELVTLNGIGPVIAERIITFREVTPFITIQDLLKINGIGEVVFAKIKDFITV